MMHLAFFEALWCAATVVSVPDPVVPAPAVYRNGFEDVGETQLRAWLRFLASPELAGRESGTPGYDTAARFVASVLEELDVAPLGDDGTYFQRFDLVRKFRDVDTAGITVKAPGGGEVIPLKGHVAVSTDGPNPRAQMEWTQPWVFAGHGEAALLDAPDDFHGIDLENSVVLVLPRAGVKAGEDRGARLAGARRVVVISDERVKSGAGLSFPEAPEGPPAKPAEGAPPDPLPTLFISRQAADKLFALTGTSVDKLLAAPAGPTPLALGGIEIKLTLRTAETRRPTCNIVGYLQGSDPQLRPEVVAIGAHLDHVGVLNGKIHLGADDDGSGVSAVLAAARAFHSNVERPRRSILFLFFAAEEKGLFGSKWFAEHPPIPLERFVLELQLDMVGRNEESPGSGTRPAEKAEDNTDTLHLVGSKRHSLELDGWVQSVNTHTGLRFEYDEERVYERSDQYNFGSRGVPVVFFFAGFHPDYHQPTDTVEKINFTKLVKVARLVYGVAYEVADRPARLKKHRV